ncbi:MAG: glycosyltransferase [Bacteroidales bacterium]|nr:glycosyltransferase [Bacteroidales bacterium]
MICFFNTTKAWGGGEKWHFDMATRLLDEGKKVIVITNTNSELQKRLEAKGLKPIALTVSNLSFLNVFKMLRLKRFFRKHRVRAIVMNLPADLKLAGIAARLAGVRRVIYRRGSAIPIRNTMLNRFLFKKVITDVLVNSLETKRTILSNKPDLIEPERIRMIYNGLNLSEFDLPVFPVRAQNDPVIIGNLGRLEKQKAQHLFIELGKMLREGGFNFKILIGGDGRLREELAGKIAKEGLQQFIQLVGYVKDVTAFMQQIDIFVLTSQWEGFGYVLAEAMACHKPVIAFNHSSNPELIDNQKTGFLVEPGNMDELFQKTTLMIKDKSLRLAMGKAGRERVEREFDFEQTYRQIKDFLTA